MAAVAVAVFLRKHAPPEAARLLPGADGFVYLNLQWMRRANLIGDLPSVPHDPEYEQFIQATGFQFERDLEQAALAIHYPTGAGADSDDALPRFSEVFIGKIQGDRLGAYLHKLSKSVESYNAVDIYNIPLEGRTVRVGLIGVDTVAASNHSDPQVIRGIIDRSRKLASPFGGPALLRQFYKEVPLASLAWAIFRVQSDSAFHPARWDFLFRNPAVVVASARYLGAVHFKAVAFTGSDEDAKHVTDQLGTFLNIFHTAEDTTSAPGSDADVKTLFDSLKVEQQKNRAVLSASVPVGFIHKALAEAPTEVAPRPSPATDSAVGVPTNHKSRDKKDQTH